MVVSRAIFRALFRRSSWDRILQTPLLTHGYKKIWHVLLNLAEVARMEEMEYATKMVDCYVRPLAVDIYSGRLECGHLD